MEDFFKGALELIGGFLNKAFALVLQFLPDSPIVFLERTPVVSQYLGYFNYFIPVSAMLSTLVAWGTCIAIYYVWQLVLRVIRAIE